MTLSIATMSIPGELRTKLDAIASAGFHGVELYEPDFTSCDANAADIAIFARQAGLSITAVQPFLAFEGLKGNLRDNAFVRISSKCQLVRDLGSDLMLVHTTDMADISVDRVECLENIAELARCADAAGVRVALMARPWCPYFPDEMTVFEALQQLDAPGLGVALNSFFTLSGGAKPARIRDIDGARVFHVQLSDAPKLDMDIRHLAHHFRVLPGQGDLDLAGFTRILTKRGYDGPWTVDRMTDEKPRGLAAAIAGDGYRALVTLLDDVARTEPEFNPDIPDLEPRVYASGFEFVEFAAQGASTDQLTELLETMCFRLERRHIAKSVQLWRQGAVNIVVNAEKSGFAHSAFVSHGPTVCDMGLRVKNASQTVARAMALGTPRFSQKLGTGELDIPAIRGVGGNVIHFIDEQSDLHRVWDIEFNPVARTQAVQPVGIRRIDHIAQTMKFEEMQSWLLYFITTFEMEKSPIVDVADPSGVVHSQAIQSPEGEVRLNLNGAETRRTFAGSFLADRVSAGVQHIALLTDDIFETSAHLEAAGFARLRISPNYYADLKTAYDLDDDFVARLQAGHILYDRSGAGEYFQIYSVPIFDGFFFEIVERRNGYDGYGARNAPVRLAAQLKYLRPAGVPRS
jgi:4-hydroxyphenylpyruvate dioxygenase